MSEYVKSLLIKADAETIYRTSIDHFASLGYSIRRSSEYSYLEFEREGKRIFVYHAINAPHMLTITLTPQGEGVFTTFKFNCPLGIGPFSIKSQEEADEYISSLLTKIYQKQPKVSQHPRRICPNCKREIPWDAKICPYCGYDFSKVKKETEIKKNTKTCPNCGKEVPKDALFCPYCGYKF